MKFKVQLNGYVEAVNYEVLGGILDDVILLAIQRSAQLSVESLRPWNQWDDDELSVVARVGVSEETINEEVQDVRL